MTRPAVPYAAPVGYRWLVSIDDAFAWSLSAWQVGQRRCRHTERGIRCPNDVDAVLYRGIHRRPYGYCREHLYGRWIEDGHVAMWVLRPVDP